jgi:hypothetical protein
LSRSLLLHTSTRSNRSKLGWFHGNAICWMSKWKARTFGRPGEEYGHGKPFPCSTRRWRWIVNLPQGCGIGKFATIA